MQLRLIIGLYFLLSSCLCVAMEQDGADPHAVNYAKVVGEVCAQLSIYTSDVPRVMSFEILDQHIDGAFKFYERVRDLSDFNKNDAIQLAYARYIVAAAAQRFRLEFSERIVPEKEVPIVVSERAGVASEAVEPAHRTIAFIDETEE